MASWIPPTILPASSPLPSTAYNNLANDTTFLWQKSFCSYYDSVGTPVGSGGDTIVQLGGTAFVNYGFSLINGNTVVIPVSGIYQFNFRVGMGTTANNGAMNSILFHNGNAIIFGSTCPLYTTNALNQSVGCGLLPCNANDEVFLAVLQNSGGDINCQSGSAQTALESCLVGSL